MLRNAFRIELFLISDTFSSHRPAKKKKSRQKCAVWQTASSSKSVIKHVSGTKGVIVFIEVVFVLPSAAFPKGPDVPFLLCFFNKAATFSTQSSWTQKQPGPSVSLSTPATTASSWWTRTKAACTWAAGSTWWLWTCTTSTRSRW